MYTDTKKKLHHYIFNRLKVTQNSIGRDLTTFQKGKKRKIVTDGN